MNVVPLWFNTFRTPQAINPKDNTGDGPGMSRVGKWIGRLFGRPRRTGDNTDTLRTLFRARYHSFKLLLGRQQPSPGNHGRDGTGPGRIRPLCHVLCPFAHHSGIGKRLPDGRKPGATGSGKIRRVEAAFFTDSKTDRWAADRPNPGTTPWHRWSSPWRILALPPQTRPAPKWPAWAKSAAGSTLTCRRALSSPPLPAGGLLPITTWTWKSPGACNRPIFRTWRPCSPSAPIFNRLILRAEIPADLQRAMEAAHTSLAKAAGQDIFVALRSSAPCRRLGKKFFCRAVPVGPQCGQGQPDRCVQGGGGEPVQPAGHLLPAQSGLS